MKVRFFLVLPFDSKNDKAFDYERPFLEKSIRYALKAGVAPSVGDGVYGEDEVFFIQSITFYNTKIIYEVEQR